MRAVYKQLESDEIAAKMIDYLADHTIVTEPLCRRDAVQTEISKSAAKQQRMRSARRAAVNKQLYRLTSEQIDTMCKSYIAGDTTTRLAKIYGCSIPTVYVHLKRRGVFTGRKT